MTKEELKKILENHSHWLHHDCDGWENMRADFSNCDLRYADLRYADLRYADLYSANLYSANLCSANLRSANLCSANLCSADLCSANLRYADLCSADLCSANLCSANLCSANLHSADLRSANLHSANLCYANLRYANLRYADLYSANLHSANLRYADLRSAKEIPYIPMMCPKEGDFYGWKKAQNKIIKLHIPSHAKRSSATTRKCRCNIAEVVEIYNLDGTVAKERQVESDYDSNFIYEVGKTVEVNDFDENRWNECTTGIHFFMQKQEAIAWR